jgi:hypothetical protein
LPSRRGHSGRSNIMCGTFHRGLAGMSLPLDPTGSQYTYVHRPYLRRHYLPRDELHDDEEL